MSLKDTLMTKLETQTEYWSKQIDSLRAQSEEKMAKAKDEQAEAEIQEDFAKRIQELEDNVESARQKMGELREAGEDRLSDLKKRVEEWLPSNTN
ncbi:hypothetical protein EB809_01015 [Marinobacter sp. R17]|uniref:hypothetical protein n=1 Tax=Marinobacter sp. R17 TaxID=2484250 RepID=UPI000F4C6603|nr:hypothetical protein [Marinobacter sp. R17]ROU02115.1 hypothetical protein EB809_01015 [Marinobacter sp. R17]